MTARRRAATACLAVALILAAGAARADAIDGNWCFTDGKLFNISGSNIVTPAGTKKTGLYDRHGFQYTVPANEPGAGTLITMDLLSDDVLNLWRGGGDGKERSPIEVWRRCELTT